MIIKTFQVKDLSPNKQSFFLLYGENEGLKKEITGIIINNFRENVLKYEGIDFESARIAMWDYSIKLILENPFFGKGPGSYYISSFNDMMVGNLHKLLVHSQPHNIFFQFLLLVNLKTGDHKLVVYQLLIEVFF